MLIKPDMDYIMYHPLQGFKFEFTKKDLYGIDINAVASYSVIQLNIQGLYYPILRSSIFKYYDENPSMLKKIKGNVYLFMPLSVIKSSIVKI